MIWGGTTASTDTGGFNAPFDLALDSLGNLFVTDYYNSRVQKKDAGGVWSIFLQSGSSQGLVQWPLGITVDARDNVLVTDYIAASQRTRIQKFSPNGSFLELRGTDQADQGQLSRSHGMDVSGDQLYVADTGNNCIKTGTSPSSWWTLPAADVLSSPTHVLLDARGYLYVSDSGNARILRIALPPAMDHLRTLQLGQLAPTASGAGIGRHSREMSRSLSTMTVEPPWTASTQASTRFSMALRRSSVSG